MNDFLSICPIPFSDADECIQLAHGGGGRKMQDLLRNLILPAFENPFLRTQHDGAVLGAGNSSIAFTTDSFVVRPLFFPGGDIGTLAINPLVGLTSFLAQYVLRRPLMKSNTQEFRVEGSWKDPKVSKVEAAPAKADPSVKPDAEAKP
jgi:hypothetical protein